MSRQLEQASEERSAKYQRKLLIAIDGGLDVAVSHAGGSLVGISFKLSEWEVLLTIRADFPGGPMVGFVGSAGIGECLVKATRDASRDEIRWRADKWR